MKPLLNKPDNKLMQIINDEMEAMDAEGLLYKTGEFRRSRFTGELLPVYSVVPPGKAS
jgi:hypothetical protein